MIVSARKRMDYLSLIETICECNPNLYTSFESTVVEPAVKYLRYTCDYCRRPSFKIDPIILVLNPELNTEAMLNAMGICLEK